MEEYLLLVLNQIQPKFSAVQEISQLNLSNQQLKKCKLQHVQQHMEMVMTVVVKSCEAVMKPKPKKFTISNKTQNKLSNRLQSPSK